VRINLNDILQSLLGGAIDVLEVVQILTEDNERFRSVVNGVIGDTLEAENSPLAIPMQLLGKPRGKKLCILVHGIFDTVHTWRFSKNVNQDYGFLLKKDFGYTPLYVAYNTGLHISTNGQALARLLNEAWKKNPYRVREIIFIGHSMGGLVIRSACYYGQKMRAPWVKHVKKIFFLGTPHLGSDWEKLGHLTTVILKMVPDLWSRGIATLGNKRSAGIKDLRFGYLVDEDWQGQRENAFWHDNRHSVPLLPGVAYYNVASLMAKESKNVLSEYWGDGLVHLRSATGKSFLKSKTLPFSPKHFRILRGFTHTQVTHDGQVYRQIRKWCR
jgi:triacylglycerol lipase